MTLVIYILIFSALCYYRRRTLTGAHLQEKLHADGRPYLESLMYGDKKKRVFPTLGLPVDPVQSFVIRREKGYHRFLKALGLAEEISTGDEALDKSLFFVTETPDGFRELLLKKGMTESIRRLFGEFGVKDLRCFGGRIWIGCEGVPTESYNASFAAARLEALGTIANAAEAAAQTHLPPSGFMTRPRLAVFFMIVHAALAALGIFGGLPLMMETMEIVDPWSLFLLGASISCVLMAFWIYCVFVMLGRSSWIPLVLADFAIMGIAGFFLSTIFVAREVNMHFDMAAAEVHIRPVIAKQCELTCSRGSGKRRRSSTYSLRATDCAAAARNATLREYERRDSKCGHTADFSYELAIEPWLPDQKENFVFSVSERKFDHTDKGDRMEVPAREGALGLAWVDTDEIRTVDK